MKTRAKEISSCVDAPVQFRMNESGLTWQYLHPTRASSVRFEQILHAAVFSGPTDGGEPFHLLGLLAARLICLDGLRPDVLPLLESSGAVPYRCGEHIMLEWSHRTVTTVAEVARMERRILSPLTLALWPKTAAPVPAQALHLTLPEPSRQDGVLYLGENASACTPWGPGAMHTALHDLGLALQNWLVFHGFYTDRTDLLEQLASDQIAWWSQRLPGPLFAHCAGHFPMSAVDRATWARHQTRQTLVVKPAEEPTDLDDHIEVPLEDSETEHLLEQRDSAQGAGFDRSELAAALEVLKKEHSSGMAGRTKRQWIDQLRQLKLWLKGINPVTVVLIGWISHMCERGTISKNSPAVSTIQKYASLVLLPLGEHLSRFEPEPEDWDARDLLETYKTVMQHISRGTWAAGRSALMSFQAYLVDTFDTEQLHGSLDGPLSKESGLEEGRPSQQRIDAAASSYESRVIAHVVWPHEVDWCVQACDGVPDRRLGAIAKVQFSIARECAVRYQDLSRLVAKNLCFGHDVRGPYCQIEVVRNAKRGSLKTVTSQRHLCVRNPDTLAVISDWLALRTDETPNTKAYLFGEKNSDTDRYRPAAVQSLLSRLLKRATGCPDMRFHDLRHSVISVAVAEVLMSSSRVDVSLLEIISSAAGHASPYATLRNYSHLYEQPLRLHLDIALTSGVKGTSRDMAATFAGVGERYSAMKPNTLVQMAKRRDLELSMLWHTLIHEASQGMLCEAASVPFEWSEPASSTSLARTSTDLPVLALVDAIARKAEGAEIATVARVAGLPLPLTIKLFELLEVWLLDLYRRQCPRKALRKAEQPSLKELLVQMHIKPEQTFRPMWKKLSLHLQTTAAREQMRGSLKYWEQAGLGVQLRLSKKAEPRALIGLLKCGGLGRQHLRMVIQNAKDATGASCIKTKNYMLELFQQELGVEPVTEQAQWRFKGADVYLRINPHENAIRTGASSDATPALRAWLVAFKARLILDDLE